MAASFGAGVTAFGVAAVLMLAAPAVVPRLMLLSAVLFELIVARMSFSKSLTNEFSSGVRLLSRDAISSLKMKSTFLLTESFQ